jgi:hypothetical protein
MVSSFLSKEYILSIFNSFNGFLQRRFLYVQLQARSVVFSATEKGWCRLRAKSSILEAAPFRTSFPTSMASAISCGLALLSSALATADCRHGWQLALSAAPTAIKACIRLSSSMSNCLLFTPIDAARKKKIHLKKVPQALRCACGMVSNDL